MAVFSLNTNIPAMGAERRLSENTSRLSESFERLSSGLRINRASDDAAGLAIASGLRVDGRVYSQGVRNINDGISALSIADAALEELSNVVIRQRELAAQAASGTLSFTERKALNEEANALVDEFNRIVNSTEFNDLNLTNGSISELTVQAGYGTDGSITLSLGDQLARAVGDGTFSAGQTFSAASSAVAFASGDFDGDGDIDVATMTANNGLEIYENQEGTLALSSSVASGNTSLMAEMYAVDLNGDSILDLAATSETDGDITIFFGNSNGTFDAGVTYDAEADSSALSFGDIDNDGDIDLINGSEGPSQNVSIHLNNGDGTFSNYSTVDIGDVPEGVTLGDFDRDGNLDFAAVTDAGAGIVSVLFGNGDGTFGNQVTYSGSNTATDIKTSDLNGDGYLDLVSADGLNDEFSVYLNNGDGTFADGVTYSSGTFVFNALLGDINGDGYDDIVTTGLFSNPNDVNVYLNDGEGSFSEASSFSQGLQTAAIHQADIDGDGAADLINSAQSTVKIFLANSEDVTTMQRLSLYTAEDARETMDVLDEALTRVTGERGAIGATLSRLGTAMTTLAITQENYAAAASQIADADVAEESATLVRQQILQQASAAVLGQANQQLGLALSLLAPTT